jgi:hypothetical protein
VAIGVAVANDPTPATPQAVYRGTALSDFDTTAAAVRRAPFCDRVDPAAVREALGGPGELSSWVNGQATDLVPGGDVAHEYGCRFAADGLDARAWVFAPPVTAARAATLLKQAPAKGCAAQPGAPAYGAPSAAVVCTSGQTRSVSFRGLFGDAWLSCSLALPTATATPEQLLERGGRWCVAVAQAASTD